MAKQIFGYTAIPEKGDVGYVKFITVFENENGTFHIGVRDSSGNINGITLSAEDATTLAVALNTAAFPHLKSARK